MYIVICLVDLKVKTKMTRACLVKLLSISEIIHFSIHG